MFPDPTISKYGVGGLVGTTDRLGGGGRPATTCLKHTYLSGREWTVSHLLAELLSRLDLARPSPTSMTLSSGGLLTSIVSPMPSWQTRSSRAWGYGQKVGQSRRKKPPGGGWGGGSKRR